ncbi:MAG TPA: hypothetical protein VFX30_09395 [bacterium]|nr:hypothetical protein [bacterium]
MIKARWVIVFFLLTLCACFGLDRRGGITGYKNGEADAGKARFTVRRLPPPWKQPRRLLKQLVYENDPLAATIVVDALCGPKYDDAPLNRLAAEMFQRLQKPKIRSEKNVTLDGRSAVRMDGGGAIDGVPLEMSVVVMKKNFCLYDFIYFAPPQTFSQGKRDFEEFLNGFETR